jgi:hypothetical protein
MTAGESEEDQGAGPAAGTSGALSVDPKDVSGDGSWGRMDADFYADLGTTCGTQFAVATNDHSSEHRYVQEF